MFHSRSLSPPVSATVALDPSALAAFLKCVEILQFVLTCVVVQHTNLSLKGVCGLRFLCGDFRDQIHLQRMKNSAESLVL